MFGSRQGNDPNFAIVGGDVKRSLSEEVTHLSKTPKTKEGRALGKGLTAVPALPSHGSDMIRDGLCDSGR